MHDLIQQMGLEIVREESEVSKKHKKLLSDEDAFEVLSGGDMVCHFYLSFPFSHKANVVHFFLYFL